MARKSIYPPSVQPGIPKLGKLPPSWRAVPFKKLVKISSNPAKLEDDKEYQLVTAKRSRGGIVPREKLLGDDIRTKTQFYISAGDFLISRRQIVHGACGIVPPELDGSVVSNEYLALHTNGELLKEYLAYFSHSIYFQQTCFHSSIGVDVEKMVFKVDQWLKHKMPLPPIAEQKRIVEILEVWDGAIAIVEQLITAKQKLKKALLTTCFDEEKGHYKKIGSIAKVQSGSTPSRTDFDRYFKDGTIAWVKTMDLNNGFIYKTDELITQIAVKETSCSIFPQNTILVAMYGGFNQIGRTGLLTIEAAVNQAISAIQLDQNIALPEYVLHYLNYRVEYWKRFAASSRKDPNITRKDVCDFPILVMPLEQQKRVVSLFRNLDLQIQFLIRQQQLYLKQKQGLMQKLLTGEWRVPVEAEGLA